MVGYVKRPPFVHSRHGLSFYPFPDDGLRFSVRIPSHPSPQDKTLPREWLPGAGKPTD